jgi:hypothetical protein
LPKWRRAAVKRTKWIAIARQGFLAVEIWARYYAADCCIINGSAREGASVEEFVSLKQLAAELGLDRSNMRKYVLKSDVHPHRRRTPDSGRQLTLALTVEEADQIRAKRREEGFLGASKVMSKEVGCFYVIRLVPEDR